METLLLNEYRCKCGKLLLKGVIFDASIEIKCKNCKEINKIGNIKLKNTDKHYVLIINQRGTITNCSSSACKILQYDCSELIGKHFTLINTTIPSDFAGKTTGEYSVLNEDNYFQFDTFHKTKNDKIIPITAQLKLYKPNTKDRYVLLIAEVKNTLTEKSPIEKNSLEFIDKACDFYFEVDKNGICIYINPAMEKIFQLKQENIVGKYMFDIMPENQKKEAEKVFNHFSVKEEPYRSSNDDGTIIDDQIIKYESYYTPYYNDGGNFIGYRVLGWLKNNNKS